ncbi:phage head-tail connector protein [Paenibacillus pasadenensis]|uniref:phage head-tail connector protein n=1 Tax=Paenibacillus pasadenensis TaxID=217090 RepID=UPI00203CEC32|nr:phage head-tail connector protein [Paenibacillus pasadenensis]MCM3747451.1 phage head-tail connector protein [Paenibacillus pasadenensis]
MLNPAEIRELAKKRLGLVDSTHDGLIDLYVADVEQGIKTFCNIPAVPLELSFTWAAMVAAAVTAEQSALIYPKPEAPEAYETTIGDTSVKPIAPVGVQAPPRPSVTVVDSVLFDYEAQLVRFRRLRW